MSAALSRPEPDQARQAKLVRRVSETLPISLSLTSARLSISACDQAAPSFVSAILPQRGPWPTAVSHHQTAGQRSQRDSALHLPGPRRKGRRPVAGPALTTPRQPSLGAARLEDLGSICAARRSCCCHEDGRTCVMSDHAHSSPPGRSARCILQCSAGQGDSWPSTQRTSVV